ncbi:hypothetical protein CANARDRAFT_202174 [[Candida] arabinofermentans NRRL YB-2248]|uniref:RRM domain-containing protein n=1 Tax=[Candida] arabinofermentans NRRL YB-2248 TaxID=983967 RepID=A0A1E4SWI9_9ASCO|nr:hypothetical protein CANARDRAFT_202174 [[Candida] arabinofermentans NRRL YB-2248]
MAVKSRASASPKKSVAQPSTPISKKLPSRSPIQTRRRSKDLPKKVVVEEQKEQEQDDEKIELPSDSSDDEDIQNGSGSGSDSESESDDEELKGFDQESTSNNKITSNKKESSSASVTSQQNVHSITKPLTKQTSSKSSSSQQQSSNNNNNSKKAVVYVGRIPHGFHEDELRKYFGQFGEITRLRLSRNKKTGKSKHYGFIEFQELQIAKIAVETMNNYLIFNHLLKCSILPIEKIHDSLFNGSNIKFKSVPWSKISQVRNDKLKTDSKLKKLEKKFNYKNTQKALKLKSKGINYDLNSLK